MRHPLRLITYDNLTTAFMFTVVVHNARPKPSTVSRHAQSTNWVAYNSLILSVCLSVHRFVSGSHESADHSRVISDLSLSDIHSCYQITLINEFVYNLLQLIEPLVRQKTPLSLQEFFGYNMTFQQVIVAVFELSQIITVLYMVKCVV